MKKEYYKFLLLFFAFLLTINKIKKYYIRKNIYLKKWIYNEEEIK